MLGPLPIIRVELITGNKCVDRTCFRWAKLYIVVKIRYIALLSVNIVLPTQNNCVQGNSFFCPPS